MSHIGTAVGRSNEGMEQWLCDRYLGYVDCSHDRVRHRGVVSGRPRYDAIGTA